jgi:hypothetical protein
MLSRAIPRCGSISSIFTHMSGWPGGIANTGISNQGLHSKEGKTALEVPVPPGS